MTAPKAPEGLAAGGRALWRDITSAHEFLDAQQLVQLTEACRAKDRLDEFDAVIRGRPDFVDLLHFRTQGAHEDKAVIEVKFDSILTVANATANLLKQLLAAMRLPDASGARPQQRGGARGAYGAQTPGGKTPGKVSSIERARSRKSG